MHITGNITCKKLKCKDAFFNSKIKRKFIHEY